MSKRIGARAQMVSRVNGLKIDFPTQSSNVVHRYADSQNALIFEPMSRKVYDAAKRNSKSVAVIESDPEDYNKHNPLHVNQNVNGHAPVNIVDDEVDYGYDAQANIVDDEPEKSAPKKAAPKRASKTSKSASKTPATRQAPEEVDTIEDNSDIL